MLSTSITIHPLPLWNHSPDDITRTGDIVIKDVAEMYDKVAKQTEFTKENVLNGISIADNYLACVSNVLTFYEDVGTQELRDASSECKKKLDKFENELSMRKDIFDILTKFYQERGAELNANEKRFVEHRLRDARRNGLHLEEDKQARIRQLKDKLSELSIKFGKNLNEERTTLRFKADELKGVPQDDLDRFKSEIVDGEKVYEVTLKYPDYFPTMKYCTVETTRQRLETAFNSRCLESNTPLLEEAIALRHEKAKILGFDTHADFVLDVLMAKKRDNVRKFLLELYEKLKPARDSDLRKMRRLKAIEQGILTAGSDETKVDIDGVRLANWDLRYYQTRIEEIEYQVDQTQLREYFALDSVIEQLLEIYQELLSLKFNRIETQAWHADVSMYEVLDDTDGTKEHERLGYFYFDLHPREGKYGHAACFTIYPGCMLPDGRHQLPIRALVCNFPKGTIEKPALLTHDDVETLFHEFGHAMHSICTITEFSSQSSSRVERDFVELPSQILENWVWEADGLKRVARHYKTGEPLSDKMIDRLIRSRIANVGMFNVRQIALSLFDLNAHSSEKCDTRASYAALWRELSTLELTEGTNFAASFGHLMGGYDSRYYGYLWSEVYAMDMFFSRFKKQGIFNRQLGLDYRRKVLEPGATQDGMDMCRNFLGREPCVDAFLLSKGIAVPSTSK